LGEENLQFLSVSLIFKLKAHAHFRPILGPGMALHQSPRNLFCLWLDLRFGGFDKGQFAMVPKSGKLVVHFLGFGPETAPLYHNLVFDYRNRVSHEVLYARFAWALFKMVKRFSLDPELFKLDKTDGGPTPGIVGEGGGSRGQGDGGAGGSWRGGRDTRSTPTCKRKHVDSGDGEGDGDRGPHRSISVLGQPNPMTLSQQPNSFLSNVLLKIASGDSQSSIEADAREIDEDLRGVARDYPFLGV
jgi:hypothetical protein